MALNNNTENKTVYPAQLSTQSTGFLNVRCTTPNLVPVEGATISISESGNPDKIIEELKTNESGLTGSLILNTPSIDYSQEPSINQPYSEYIISANAPGYSPVIISDSQILPDVTAIQEIALSPLTDINLQGESFVIPPHTLFGDFPPKIAESEVKSVEETGEIVLESVVIPEFIIVHDGPPSCNRVLRIAPI